MFRDRRRIADAGLPETDAGLLGQDYLKHTQDFYFGTDAGLLFQDRRRVADAELPGTDARFLFRERRRITVLGTAQDC